MKKNKKNMIKKLVGTNFFTNSNILHSPYKSIIKRQVIAAAAAMLLIATSCQKDQITNEGGLHVNGVASYIAVNESPTTKVINKDVIHGLNSFDEQQAWFDFTTVSSSQKGKATDRNAWHLGFYAQNEDILVNGKLSNSLVYLNYAVNTQGKEILGFLNLTDSVATTTFNELDNAVNLFNGGKFNMGDLSTYDFHSESQFVIGSADVTERFYLIRTSEAVQIHPDSTTKTNLFAVSVSKNPVANEYLVDYRAINKSGDKWIWSVPKVSKVIVKKNRGFQSHFLNFTSGVTKFLQPLLRTWNLGLSAVVLKRYINPVAGGGAYPFALKGVVLNNNPAVKVYRVQNTPSTAGAPGPFDPNYSWQNDPALLPANDITTEFDNFNVANIDDSKFRNNSQEEIGQYYRYLDMGNYRVFVDRFYVIKLQNGDVYKLRFEKIVPGVPNSTTTPVNNGIQIKYAKIATS